jgi:uracil-DNA glycosylase family 4
MIVGEAPGEQEVLRREPFVGQSGEELNRMLHEAGIGRNECFITNVCRERPPDNNIDLWITPNKKCPEPSWISVNGKWCHPYIAAGYKMLLEEIRMVGPNVIIAFGNTALWALTGKWGIKSWRGSLLQTGGAVKVIPAYHPAYILRDWSSRQITVHDLKRARAQSGSRDVPRTNYFFVIRPSFDQVSNHLKDLIVLLNTGPTTISCDIETRAGHIACLGLALDKSRALCIPFMCTENENGYWQEEEEVAIVKMLRAALCHTNARVIGQNFIYDSQYIFRHWGFVPNFARDTMLGHHCCFAGMPKGLDFLSSMYCEQHVYWKDEGKTWDKNTGEEQLWAYNCKDCVITFECDEAIQSTTNQLGLRGPHDFQQQMFWPVLEAMVRGVRVDLSRRKAFAEDLQSELEVREAWFLSVLEHPLNPKSPKQMKALFYEDLKQPPIYTRAKKGQPPRITLDDDALERIGKREPLLRPLVRRIAEYRTLNVFRSVFIGAKLDIDQRLRCSYNIAGTETFRLSSSQDAFDSGLNLQNIPRGGKDDKDDVEALQLPNVRRLFVPDEGFTFFDCDLDRADLQVVVAEANDESLREAMSRGVDMHLFNMRVIHDIDIPDDEILESHPKCREHKERYYAKRHQTKEGVHAVNYLCQPRTLATTLGVSIHEAEKFTRSWFAAHPGIQRWHIQVLSELKQTRAVTNRFGYRRPFFDRLDSVASEAVAWIPQSTVAIYINRLWKLINDNEPSIQVLLQVHDSLAGQFLSAHSNWAISRIRELANTIVVPYNIPLTIPLGIKTSEASWGDCK